VQVQNQHEDADGQAYILCKHMVMRMPGLGVGRQTRKPGRAGFAGSYLAPVDHQPRSMERLVTAVL